jgi:hypothetical protein
LNSPIHAEQKQFSSTKDLLKNLTCPAVHFSTSHPEKPAGLAKDRLQAVCNNFQGHPELIFRFIFLI